MNARLEGKIAALRRVAAEIVRLLSAGRNRKTPGTRGWETRDCDRTTTACPGVAFGLGRPARDSFGARRISSCVRGPVKRGGVRIPAGERVVIGDSQTGADGHLGVSVGWRFRVRRDNRIPGANGGKFEPGISVGPQWREHFACGAFALAARHADRDSAGIQRGSGAGSERGPARMHEADCAVA